MDFDWFSTLAGECGRRRWLASASTLESNDAVRSRYVQVIFLAWCGATVLLSCPVMKENMPLGYEFFRRCAYFASQVSG